VHVLGIRSGWLAAAAIFAAQACVASSLRAKDEQDALTLAPAADQAYGLDFRGRHITDDVREMSADFVREGTAAPSGTLIPDPKNLSTDQRSRAQTLFDYWALYPALAVNRDVWDNFLTRNHFPAGTAHSGAVQSAEKALQEKLNTGHISSAWTELGQQLLKAYIEERNQLVRAGADAKGPEQARTAACPPAVHKLSPTERPKFDRAARALTDYWPEAARRLGEEGTVVLKVQVSAAGCTTNAAITGSSGFADLDEAVMKFYENLLFLPAQRNGSATDAVANLPIAFKLQGVATR
jgi:TonB family protein